MGIKQTLKDINQIRKQETFFNFIKLIIQANWFIISVIGIFAGMFIIPYLVESLAGVCYIGGAIGLFLICLRFAGERMGL